MATVHEVEEPAGISPAIVMARIIYLIFGVIIAFIALRMIFLLLAANQANAFVDFIYSVSGLFVSPFFGIFGRTLAYNSSVFEFSSLVAIIVYVLICWGLVSLLTIGSRRRSAI